VDHQLTACSPRKTNLLPASRRAVAEPAELGDRRHPAWFEEPVAASADSALWMPSRGRDRERTAAQNGEVRDGSQPARVGAGGLSTAGPPPTTGAGATLRGLFVHPLDGRDGAVDRGRTAVLSPPVGLGDEWLPLRGCRTDDVSSDAGVGGVRPALDHRWWPNDTLVIRS